MAGCQCIVIRYDSNCKLELSVAERKTVSAVCRLAACLTSQQHASVSQGLIYSDNCTCYHTEIQVADQTVYLTQSQYTDTGPTSPSADPVTPGAWQGSQWSANFEVTGMTRPGKIPSQAGFELRTLRFLGGRLNHLANEAVVSADQSLRYTVLGNATNKQEKALKQGFLFLFFVLVLWWP